MGIIKDASPVPETYAGPVAWWNSQKTGGVTILDRDLTGADMLVAAGIDWTASKRRLIGEDLDGHFDDHDLIPGWVAMKRDTDNAFLGMVTPTYHEFQFSEMAVMTDKALELTGAHYHTGGSLYGGRLGWLLAKFDKAIHVKGDDSAFEAYLLAITGHDGRHALQFAETETRVVCGNTADMAIQGSSNKVSLRHTSGMADRTAEVQRALGIIVKHREKLEVFLNSLADRAMTIDEFKRYTEVLIPLDPTKDAERQPRTTKKRDDLAALFANSQTMVGLPFTAYRAFQATTEYLDQKVDYKATKKMDANTREALAVIEGKAYDLKTTAARLLVKA